MNSFLDDMDDEEEKDEEPEEIQAEVKEVSTVDNTGGDESLPVAQNNDFVKPVDNPEEVVEMYEQFDGLKTKLLDIGKDTTEISGSQHVNKSGWRKFATLFNLSMEVIEDERTVIERGDGKAPILRWKAKARATAPNGKVCTGSGISASNESNHMVKLGDHPGIDDTDHPDVVRVDGKWRVIMDPAEVNEHNVYTIACTRAKNRAISDMVGGGEVSAEELETEDFFD